MEHFEKLVESMAKQNGTTPEHVLEEMQRAIDLAWDNRNAATRQLWDKMTFKGERPTPEEVIVQLALLNGTNGKFPL